jgi:ABC-2 type transport system permease protein
MFSSIFKKDLKIALKNPLHIGTIFIFPIIIICIFSLTMKHYMNNEFGTFDNAKVFYYLEEPSEEAMEKFNGYSAEIKEATGTEFIEVKDYGKAQTDVEKSEAYAVIKIKNDSFDYYRSPYNEPYGGEIIRSLFAELSDNDAESSINVVNINIPKKKVNAEVYYTFAGLAIALLFLGMVITNSFGTDHNAGTLKRIMMSKTGASYVIGSKFLCGLIFGIIQTAIAIGLSTIIFKIKWDNYLGLIILVHFAMLMFSIGLSLMVGSLLKNTVSSFEAICYITMFSNYLGGSITPIYLLEKIPVMKYVIRISPIYWTNQSLSSLYNGVCDSKTTGCLIVLFSLAIVFTVVAYINTASMSKSPQTDIPTEKSSREAVKA